MSRSSVYETIEEKAGGLGSSTNSKVSSATAEATDVHTVLMSPPFHAPARFECISLMPIRWLCISSTGSRAGATILIWGLGITNLGSLR